MGRMEASLEGRTILLTRAAEQLPALAEMVRQRGGVPVEFPCLKVQVCAESVRRALQRLDDYGDVAFTSRNGVASVAAIAGDLARALAGRRVAAVGEATARALRERGVQPQVVAEQASQEGLFAAYREFGMPRRLLFFRATEGREFLVQALREAGAEVDMIPVYRTSCPADDASEVIRMLEQNRIDAVLLGSPKVVRHYVQRIGNVLLADRPVVIVISEQVARAAMDAGLSVQAVARRASFDAMLDELAALFAGQRAK